ncbi:MAG TPA: PRC-barrel domain-containing protein [Gemmatimonadaceae bacterium]|nr:PRC-barrel domain-containing protein [Gemmatimonadaceae bacterium]
MADREIDRERLRRDAAGVGPYAREDERLVSLNDLDRWDVAEGEPDVRGWEVRTVGGRELGSVKDLLVDPDAREVVMLDVDLSGSDQHALVPIRIVQLDRPARVIRMDSADLTPAEREAAREIARSEGAQDAVSADEAAATREAEASRVERRKRWAESSGQVRFPRNEEVVVERRPMVEEVVVRRRPVDEPPGDVSSDADAKRAAEERADRADDRR